MNREIEERLGHEFRDATLLDRALTHRSAASSPAENNEILEFLGDAAIDLAVSAWLMERFPDAREGELTRLRASLVNRDALADRAREINLGSHLRLGRGEERSGGRDKPSILATAFEAIVGALFLESDFDAMQTVVRRLFATPMESLTCETLDDPKTDLQEWAQGRGLGAPTYELVRSEGPDHARRFAYEVRIADAVWGRGEGPSRQVAEREAARIALAKRDKD